MLSSMDNILKKLGVPLELELESQELGLEYRELGKEYQLKDRQKEHRLKEQSLMDQWLKGLKWMVQMMELTNMLVK